MATSSITNASDVETARVPTRLLSSPILVGRREELGLITGVTQRPPSVVVLEGEAGVGKTRLINELSASLGESRRVLIGNCHHVSEPFPLAPIISALAQYSTELDRDSLSPITGALRPLIPELAAILPDRPEDLGDQRAERHRIFRGLAELLAAHGSAVLVLEDLHWGDRSTLEFIGYLTREMMPDSLSLVLTLRRENVDSSSALHGVMSRFPHNLAQARLTLDPLDFAEARKLASAILVEDVSEEFARFLHESTSGNPFALEEVLRLLQDRKDLVKREGHWVRRKLEQLDVPDGIRDSILERLSRVSAGARTLIECAAVAGDAQSAEDLATIANVSENEWESSIRDALSSGLLIEQADGVLSFRHALARQAVYDSVPHSLRKGLHLRVAQRLQGSFGDAPTKLMGLAHHYRSAESAREWADYAERAADQASEIGDDSTAYNLLCSALEAPGNDPSMRARLGIKLGQAALHGLAHEDAIQILRELIQEERLDPSDRAELRYWLGHVLVQNGQYAEAANLWQDLATELLEQPGDG